MEQDWSYLEVDQLSPAKGKKVRRPGWGPIERALRDLPDSPTDSMVTLSLEREVESFPTMSAIHDGGAKIGMMFRCDRGELAPNVEHVELEAVLAAFKIFFEEKRLDPALGWDYI